MKINWKTLEALGALAVVLFGGLGLLHLLPLQRKGTKNISVICNDCGPHPLHTGTSDQIYEQTRLQAEAEGGNAKAQIKLGDLYELNEEETRAAKWYRKAAEKGNAEAQFLLGSIYQAGHGMRKDYTEASKWYLKAANQGYAKAQFNIGYMYEHGEGVKQDYAEALKWYRSAADQNDCYAQVTIGAMYEDGQVVKQDYGKAIEWYRKAAGQRLLGAYANLGRLYEAGLGVKQDYIQAYMWISLAMPREHKGKNSWEENLASHMTPEEVSEAKTLAVEWKKAHPGPAQE